MEPSLRPAEEENGWVLAKVMGDVWGVMGRGELFVIIGEIVEEAQAVRWRRGEVAMRRMRRLDRSMVGM